MRPHYHANYYGAFVLDPMATISKRSATPGVITLTTSIRHGPARARRNDSGFNYWPGFVDALSTLVLSIVFLLTVFLVVQFFLSQEVTGKDKALEQLNAKIAQLNDLLSLEKLAKLNLDDQISHCAPVSPRGGRARPHQGAL